MKRDRYDVGPTPRAQVKAGERDWRVSRNGDLLSYSDTQRGAIDLAVLLARKRWSELGQPAELVIKGENGKIRDTRTYGNDPRGIKG